MRLITYTSVTNKVLEMIDGMDKTSMITSILQNSYQLNERSNQFSLQLAVDHKSNWSGVKSLQWFENVSL
jgi:hypothetical protein